MKLTKPREKMSYQEFRKFLSERHRRREDYPIGGLDDGHQITGSHMKSEAGRVTKDDRGNIVNINSFLAVINVSCYLLQGKFGEKQTKESENVNSREVALIKYNNGSSIDSKIT